MATDPRPRVTATAESDTDAGRYEEVLRSAYEEFAAGNLDAVLAIFDDDIEWIVAEGFPFGGTYHGPAAVRDGVFLSLRSAMSKFDVLPDRFVDAGDTVVVLGRYDGVSNETGRAFTGVPWAHVWDFEDGRAVRFSSTPIPRSSRQRPPNTERTAGTQPPSHPVRHVLILRRPFSR